MMTIPLDLVDNFHTDVHDIKSQMDKLKRSIDPMGMYFLVKLTSFLPTILAKLMSQDQAEKISMVFSNVPGPKTPLVFLGKKVEKIIFFAPALGSLSAAISIMSHVDNVKIGCVSDES